jgi:ornithine cyclodeaminase/alanine dehydrogenase-like protein (mu-crystallin family)
MLVLSRSDVASLLDPDALVDALSLAMADLSAGRASVPPRVAARVSSLDAMLAAMPGFVPSLGVLETKLVSVFPRNEGTALPTHQAVIVVFDVETGEPAALMDGTFITAARTAAGSALSTRLLAREDAHTLAILGSGVQARAHAKAVSRVRPIAEIRVASRDRRNAEALAGELSATLGIRAGAASSYAEAMDGADVVCAATHAVEPVIRRSAVAPGMHLTSVGYNQTGREVDAETFRDALVVVESRAAALAPAPSGAPDLLAAIAEGVISESIVHAEIGEVVTGARPGRSSQEQITLYRSVGVAVQDAAAANLVLAEARARGAGVTIEL